MASKTNTNSGWESFFRNRKVTFLPDWVRDLFFGLITPAVKLAIRAKLHPNFFTITGLLLSIVAAIFFASGHFLGGGFFLLLSGCCDVFDGMIARARGVGSKFGALFDSALDRYAEMFVLFGVSYCFIRQNMIFTAMIALFALGGSLMVSYVRARAEGLGLDCKVGIMQRAERIVYMGFGAMVGQIPFIVVLYAIVFLAHFTAIQRIVHVWQLTRTHEPAEEPAEQKENKVVQ